MCFDWLLGGSRWFLVFFCLVSRLSLECLTTVARVFYLVAVFQMVSGWLLGILGCSGSSYSALAGC